ncbi:hypothetical protein [Pseudanabaena sp. FACHB-2040]|uniref:hypothetical protein n=1 Tax=Pseudanabaena sp. FACHB-2040 TaxID=2692859 RepID=UPI00168897D4|nr:hypothetical protein [Pseudanabaena sp. FACHB-2040]MBD2256148.1 hypothetical protein [Pseudanabaena sp. FACHB-2040]
MSRKGFRGTQPIFIFSIAFVSALGLTLAAAQTWWGQGFTRILWTCLVAALPGLHGALVASSALQYHRQTQSSKESLTVELICAGLLATTTLVTLLSLSSLLAFYFGWVLAAAAALPLAITGSIETLQAVKRKRHRRRNLVRLLLNVSALLIYCLLVFFSSFLVIMWLSGEPYMGN